MGKRQIVLDTNVLVAALRSQRGAAYQLLRRLDSGKFELNLSVPLVLEYEDAAKRLLGQIPLSVTQIEDIIDYLCAIAQHRQVFYLWRPCLRDAKDDMVLELAVVAGADCIVTFNRQDFQGAEQFGIRIVTPQEFLREIGEEDEHD
jgi:putative PIN family toxin of toxin-antitoxin system